MATSWEIVAGMMKEEKAFETAINVAKQEVKQMQADIKNYKALIVFWQGKSAALRTEIESIHETSKAESFM